jgi:ribonuclease HII
MRRNRVKFIIGIDEAGRGPLAGPVYVAAVAVPAYYRFQNAPGPLRDSKKLTARARAAWRAWIMKQKRICYAVCSADNTIIDRINISRAANRAAMRAYRRVAKCLARAAHGARHAVITDAGLRLRETIAYRSAPQADETYPAVALASILAKTARDRCMERTDKRYPAYRFARHKGYGTPAHIAAIRACGTCPIHRLTFLQNIRILKTD